MKAKEAEEKYSSESKRLKAIILEQRGKITALYAKWSKGHVCGLSEVDFDPFCQFLFSGIQCLSPSLSLTTA